jgi:hypothetical protein
VHVASVFLRKLLQHKVKGICGEKTGGGKWLFLAAILADILAAIHRRAAQESSRFGDARVERGLKRQGGNVGPVQNGGAHASLLPVSTRRVASGHMIVVCECVSNMYKLNRGG